MLGSYLGEICQRIYPRRGFEDDCLTSQGTAFRPCRTTAVGQRSSGVSDSACQTDSRRSRRPLFVKELSIAQHRHCRVQRSCVESESRRGPQRSERGIARRWSRVESNRSLRRGPAAHAGVASKELRNSGGAGGGRGYILRRALPPLPLPLPRLAAPPSRTAVRSNRVDIQAPLHLGLLLFGLPSQSNLIQLFVFLFL